MSLTVDAKEFWGCNLGDELITYLVDTSLSGGCDVADAEVDVVSLALPAEGHSAAGTAEPGAPLPGEPVVEAKWWINCRR